MILSMTGFGDANCIQDGVSYHLEIRSLNNRYFKLNCKLPDAAAFLEAAIDSRLRRALGRGSINLVLQVRNMSAEAAYEVNEVALASYIGHLRGMASAGGELPMTVDLATAILLPGVAQPRQEDQARQQELARLIDRMLDEALAGLNGMRAREGQALQADLDTHLERMARQLDVIAQRAPAVVAEYQQRLAERVNQLLANQQLQLQADTLAREVALFADRSDVNEEVARLRSHIEQFRAGLAEGEPGGPEHARAAVPKRDVSRLGGASAGGPNEEVEANPQVGRKLDFIAQEFLREANTIGAKSNDAAIIRACVEIKSAIDRIKEQVQNVV